MDFLPSHSQLTCFLANSDMASTANVKVLPPDGKVGTSSNGTVGRGEGVVERGAWSCGQHGHLESKDSAATSCYSSDQKNGDAVYNIT